MQREIHPGQAMHMATTWIVAYYLFSALTKQCNVMAIQKSLQPTDQHAYIHPPQSQVLAHEIQKNIPIRPRSHPTSMPPPLSSNLTLDTISSMWHEAALIAVSDCQEQLLNGKKRCPVSWNSGLPWREAEWIKNFFQPIVLKPYEWEIIDYSFRGDKLGWMPIFGIANAKLVMEFCLHEHKADQIRKVTIFYMKSYGKRWRSAAKLHIERMVDGEWVAETVVPKTLVAHHDKNTSETYSERYNFVL
jgi:hypothetical protein